MKLRPAKAPFKAADLKIEVWPIGNVKPTPDNTRNHSALQVRALAKSISTFKLNAPLLIDRDGVLIAGNGRLAALKLLGVTEVPVIKLDHLSPDEARAYAIADNRLSDLSSFDSKALGRHFEILAGVSLDFDLDATAFSVGEIDLLIEEVKLAPPGAAEHELAEPVVDDTKLAPVTGPGDIWRLGEHRIACCDALEADSYVRLLLPGEKVASCFTDLPYNLHQDVIARRGRHRAFVQGSGEMKLDEFDAFQRTAFERIAAVMKAGGVLFSCIDWRSVSMMEVAAKSAGFQTLNLCVWVKSAPGQGALYRSQHECVWVLRKGRTQHRNNIQMGKYGRGRSNIWEYDGAAQFMKASEDGDLVRDHPTPKPVKMVADAILDVTAPGEVVLDPFSGSGATLLAAERTRRKFRGLDLDPLYVDLAIRRWMRLTGQDAILEATGETFIERERLVLEARS